MDDNTIFEKVSTPGSIRIAIDDVAAYLSAGDRVYGYTGEAIIRVYDAERAQLCHMVWVGRGSIPVRQA